MNEQDLRQQLVTVGQSLFQRGYCCGTSGNLSVHLPDAGFLMTPTNVSLGRLAIDRISRLDEDGRHIAGDPPTKEAWLHLAMYRSRPHDHAVVHLHSTYAVALSCRTDRPEEDVMPALTPYVVMRVGRLPLVPYARPGSTERSTLIEQLAVSHRAVLLANHGPVVAGEDLETAAAASEELEETARLFFTLEGRPHCVLRPEQVEELHRVFGPRR